MEPANGSGSPMQISRFEAARASKGLKIEIDRIFEKFYRGEKQRQCVPGTGMGLPIAKSIVKAHGGTMCTVSHAGQGSLFRISLPAER